MPSPSTTVQADVGPADRVSEHLSANQSHHLNYGDSNRMPFSALGAKNDEDVAKGNQSRTERSKLRRRKSRTENNIKPERSRTRSRRS
jgi:hypothetical protein